jgi:hypothetical protein
VDQAEIIAYTIRILERLELPYAIVGSVASIAYGESRYTHDVDILIELPESKAGELCAAFPAPEWYVNEAAVKEALLSRRQFNVIHTLSGNKADFIIPRRTPWGSQQLSRRREITVTPNLKGFAAHPEDVILGKLLYFREGGSDRHLRDIAGMLQVSGDQIDRDNVARWAEDLGVLDIWQRILERFHSDLPPSQDTSW